MGGAMEEIIVIRHGSAMLEGSLSVPEGAGGIVLFAHGSGSSRKSPRNNVVAAVLRINGFATLLMDLLTPEEDRVYDNRFNIDLLAERLVAATDLIVSDKRTRGLNIGYFGASTGAGAAVVASVKTGGAVKAIVSRGGRADLAKEHLPRVEAPTLLIVGGNDTLVLDLNVQAYKQLICIKELAVVPDATHLFEEPGALEAASNHAIRWFKRYLSAEHAIQTGA